MADYFAQAATRHLHDAQVLCDLQRWDNAVYLAGYVVECTLKALVEIYKGKKQTRDYGHNLNKLQESALTELRLVSPKAATRLPKTTGTVLEKNHPGRRYAQSNLWTQSEAEKAVNRAREIHKEIIPRLVLDGLIPSEALLS
ncbi:HEPN domain-containing protein [Heliophilum fasciatum]|nr:HEPN domain-containing protein [Heliophilum fasciatum]MCW2279216.1 HEPN domain-containing protein [Heliophilum fasciatum]